MNTARSGSWGVLWLVLSMMFLTACGGGGGGGGSEQRADTGPTVSKIEVTPGSSEAAKGVAMAFKATAIFSDNGTADVTAQVSWSSEDATIAIVDSKGVATGRKEGSTRILAKLGDQSGSAAFTVTAALLTGLQVTPSNPSLPKGITQAFKATAVFSDSTTVDVTASATWASSQAEVVSISNTAGSKGSAKALKEGQAEIFAVYDTESASTTVTVTSATVAQVQVAPVAPSIAKGTTQQFAATAVYTDGTNKDVTTTAVWTSSAEAVATVSKGLAKGLAVGESSIAASFGGQSDSTTLKVSAATVTGISVSPANVSIAKGLHQQFTATASFTDGSQQDVTAATTWTSATESVAKVSNADKSRGDAEAVAVGSTTIGASYKDKVATASLKVTKETVTKLEVTPANISLAKGLEQQYTATALYTDGSTQNVTTSAAWSTSNTDTVADLGASDGKAKAKAVGQTTITASFKDTVSSQTVAASTTLTVTAATVKEIQVTPTTTTIPKGTAQQFTATALLTDNKTQDATTQVTWTSDKPDVAQISNTSGSNGLAVGKTVGSGVTITAALNNIKGTATLAVSDAKLTAINVTPASGKLAKGFNRQFTATGTYSDGSTANITGTATWESSNDATATVNGTDAKGLVSGVAAGQSTISATADTIKGSTTLTVTDATLSSLQVTPANPSVPKGRTQQFTATGSFSDASTLDVTTQVTWESSKTDVATISNAPDSRGLAQTAAVGDTTITAKHGTKSGSTNLKVTNAVLTGLSVTPKADKVCPGQTQQFTATGSFSDGSSENVTDSVTWSSSSTGVATISNASGSKGVASSVSTGTTTITATDATSSISDSTGLTVTGGTIVGITISPANASLPVGIFLDYSATGQFSDCPQRDVTKDVSWKSLDSTVTISNAAGSQGRASAQATGPATIVASLLDANKQLVSGSTSLSVTGATLTGLDIAPKNALIGGNQTVQFTATGSFSDGSTHTLTRQVTWASSNTQAVTISNAAGSEGQATAGSSVGQSTISATRDGVSTSTTLTRVP